MLKGHQKGIRDLSFNKEIKFLVSSAYDFDIYIWNPYIELPVAKLSGHEAPVIGISCLPAMGLMITCDLKGAVKFWDTTTHNTILSYHVEVTRVKSMIALPRHRRVVIGGDPYVFSIALIL